MLRPYTYEEGYDEAMHDAAAALKAYPDSEMDDVLKGPVISLVNRAVLSERVRVRRIIEDELDDNVALVGWSNVLKKIKEGD